MEVSRSIDKYLNKFDVETSSFYVFIFLSLVNNLKEKGHKLVFLEKPSTSIHPSLRFKSMPALMARHLQFTKENNVKLVGSTRLAKPFLCLLPMTVRMKYPFSTGDQMMYTWGGGVLGLISGRGVPPAVSKWHRRLDQFPNFRNSTQGDNKTSSYIGQKFYD